MGRHLAMVGLLALMSAGCPASYSTHSGYGDGKSGKEPWSKTKKVKWKDDNTAKIDDAVSYPQKKRARWYLVDLPGDGELVVKFDVTPAEGLDSVKLGFEVLDAGYRPILRVYDDEEFFPDKKGRVKKAKKADDEEDEEDEGEDDEEEGDDDDDDDGDDDDDDGDDDDDDDGGGDVAGESGDDMEWERTVPGLRKGIYYVHIYTTDRTTIAEYSMKLTYKAADLGHESNFPKEVAYLDFNDLAIIPVTDDTPQLDCKTCDCKTDPRCKSSCDRCEKPPSRNGGGHTTKPTPVDCESCDCNDSACKKKCKEKCGGTATACLSARILRPMSAGGGTTLVLSKGQNDGVTSGWKGRVVDAKGKGIEGGDFTINTVAANSSQGTVRATPDAVRAASGGVRICPP